MNSIQFIANTVDKHLLHNKEEQLLHPQHTKQNSDTASDNDTKESPANDSDRESGSKKSSGDEDSSYFDPKSGSSSTSNEKPTPKQEKKKTVWSTTVYVVCFLPDNLIRKPLFFVWLIITYPFTYFFSLDPSNHNYQFSVPSTPSDLEHEFKSSSSLRKRDSLPDEIKSPTSYSKYIIPPPKHLFPIYRNPPKKKTLILDLDETLIHSLSRGARMASAHMVEIKINNMAALYYVHKRPYCDEFLKEVSKWYELIIFTASVKEYADPVIDWIDNGENFFKKRYYRDHCTFRAGAGYIKDLSSIATDLSSVIIIDNSPISYALHEENAIMIEGWINDPSDADLLHLIPLLNSLRHTTDVRSILSLKNGEAAFECNFS